MATTIQDLERRFESIDRGAPQDSPDDQELGIAACREALRAAQEGNYGVGAVLTDVTGQIVGRGRNQAFQPRFRSDLHAEMVVMNEFEDRCPHSTDMRGYSLICSLEPCPMCLSRLLIAGVERVKYVARDELGGMASKIEQLPEAFRKLRHDGQFVEAQVSNELRALALDLFLLNLATLRTKLWNR